MKKRMKAESCPHCHNMVLFRDERCPRCRKHRNPAEELSADQRLQLNDQTRRRLYVESQVAQPASEQARRLKRISLFSELAAYVTTICGVLQFSPIGVLAGAMLIAAARFLRGGTGVKVFCIFLMLASAIGVLWCGLTLYVFLDRPMSGRWLIPSLRLVALPLFITVIVLCWKAITHGFSQRVTPPPVPLAPPSPPQQQAGDKT
jgi:hypothetical protein